MPSRDEAMSDLYGNASHGVQLGDASHHLKFYVEVLKAGASGSRWGNFTWGNGTWSGGWDWIDLSDRATGLSTHRGAYQINDRPRIGEYTITLNNDDLALSMYYGETEPGGIRPGDVIRAGIRVDVNGYSRNFFTGLVESVRERTDAIDKVNVVEVTAIDTLSFLAEIDEKALDSVVGSGQNLPERIITILNQSQWPFPSVDSTYSLVRYLRYFIGDPGDPYYVGADAYDIPTLQSTDLALNRLQEVYLSADSSAGFVYSGRKGEVLIRSWRDQFKISGGQWPMIVEQAPSYDPPNRAVIDDPDEDLLPLNLRDMDELQLFTMAADSFQTVTDRQAVTNTVRFARVGGSALTPSEDSGSRADYGKKVYTRNDLITTNDSMLGDVQDDYLENFITTEPYLITLDLAVDQGYSATLTGPGGAPSALLDYMEIYDGVFVYREFIADGSRSGVLFLCRLISMQWDVVPVGEGADFKVSVTLQPVHRMIVDDFFSTYTEAVTGPPS